MRRGRANAVLSEMVLDGATDGELRGTAHELGLSPCVAEEWANEPDRREALYLRRAARRDRREASAFGVRGEDHRRIISVEERDGRRHELHATKGPRSYRAPG